MKTHQAGFMTVVLLAALFSSAGAEQPSGMRLGNGSSAGESTRPQSVAMAHRAPVAATEESGHSVRAGGEGVAHVARLAGEAMRNLVGTVGEWKRVRGL